MALEPDPPEELEPDDVLDPPLELPPDGGDERGGGAERTGRDCGIDGIDGIGLLVEPPPLDVDVDDPELGGGGGGGASRGIACAAAIAGRLSPVATTETRSKRLILIELPSTSLLVQLYCHRPGYENWSFSAL